MTPLNLHPNPQDLTLGETSQVSQRQVSSYPALRGSVLTVCSPVLGWGTGAYVKQKISPQFSGSVLVVTILRGKTPKYNNVKVQRWEQLQPHVAQLPAWHRPEAAASFVCLLSVFSPSPSARKAQAFSVVFPITPPVIMPRPAA